MPGHSPADVEQSCCATGGRKLSVSPLVSSRAASINGSSKDFFKCDFLLLILFFYSIPSPRIQQALIPNSKSCNKFDVFVQTTRLAINMVPLKSTPKMFSFLLSSIICLPFGEVCNK